MENETDDVVSGVSTLSMAVERSGPLSFADICDLGAEVAATLADAHDDGVAHGHVGVGSVVRLDDGPWRLAPSELVSDVEAVPAPELGAGEATSAGDVYALGAVLSFGLTGVAVDPGASDPGADDPAAEAAPVLDPSPSGLDDPIDVDVEGDVEGERPLELSADDLDRLRNFGAPSTGDTTVGDRDAGLTESDDDADSAEAIDLTDAPGGSPMTLPEVMSSFLVVLRSSLADDPADRPSASGLAATLRQLRSDADSALGGALVSGATAVAIGDAPAGAEPWGAPSDGTSAVERFGALPPPPDALQVEGTGSAATLGAGARTATAKKTFKDRAPMIVAVAAVVVALLLGVSLVRERNDNDADLLAVGPTVGTTVRRSTTTSTAALPVDLIVETTTTLATSTTTSTSTTAPPPEVVVETTVPTTLPTTTTEPPTTLAPTTTAPTTTTTPAVSFKQARVVCATPANPANPCQLFDAADATSAARSSVLATGLNLQATCLKGGQAPYPGGLDTWLYIIGPAPTYSGWLSATHLGGAIPSVAPCQASQTP